MTQRRNVILVLGAAVITVAAVMFFTREYDGYMVKAELANAGGLRKDSSVKVNGVPAGTVKDLEITKQGTALATLHIDEGAAPFGKDARLNVRPTDLLGERYAEIKVGNQSDPLPRGALITKDKAAVPVELDDILNMLDADTSTRLGILINEVGIAMAGRGTDFNKLLAQLPSSLEETTQLIKQAADENRAIKAGIRRADRVTALVNNRRKDLGSLISQASDSLNVVAERREDLGRTIQNAPGALRQLRGTLASLDEASVELRPAARDIQATTAPLRTTLAALPSFQKEAGPALDKAREVSPALTRLGRGATPTVRKLAPTARNVNSILNDSAPILKQLDRRGFDDLMFFFNNFNLGLRDRDAIGHFISAKLNVSADYVAQAIEAVTNTPGSNTPTRSRRSGSGGSSEPSRPQEAPDQAGGTVKKPLDDVTKAVDKTVGDVKKALDDIAGVAPKVLEDTSRDAGKLVDGLRGNQGSGGKQGSTGQSDALRLFDYLMGQ